MTGRIVIRLGTLALATTALTALVACNDLLLDEQTLTITDRGSVRGYAYFDADGSESETQPDEPYEDLWVKLVTLGGGTVARADTDSLGRFLMPQIPVGAYRVVLDEALAPDSVLVFGVDEPTPFVVAGGDTAQVVLRVAFGTVPLAEVRASPPGRRVITHGIALNPRNSFGDGVVHLQEGDVYLRATDVARSGLNAGDSVRFIGITAVDQGQPVLTDVRSVVLIDEAVLVIPRSLSTAAAASAAGGTLDAALVRIQNAAVVDTASTGSDLVVTVNDGSGPLALVLRGFIGFNRQPFIPGVATIEEAVGLLVPVQTGPGQIRWRMTPRFEGDVRMDNGDP